MSSSDNNSNTNNLQQSNIQQVQMNLLRQLAIINAAVASNNPSVTETTPPAPQNPPQQSVIQRLLVMECLQRQAQAQHLLEALASLNAQNSRAGEGRGASEASESESQSIASSDISALPSPSILSLEDSAHSSASIESSIQGHNYRLALTDRTLLRAQLPLREDQRRLENLIQRAIGPECLRFTFEQAKLLVDAGLVRPHGSKETADNLRYKCVFCNVLQVPIRSFRRTEQLQRHYHNHLDIRLYKCSVCDKRFKRTDHLRRHFKTQHPNQYKIIYE